MVWKVYHYWTATNIYVTPTTLSGITFNFLMSLSGGLLAGYGLLKVILSGLTQVD